MKHLSYLFVLLALLWSNNIFAYDIAVENADGVTIYYNYINDGKELEVTGIKKPYSGNIVIPEEVTYMNRTRKVTKIGYASFSGCNITSVTIPNSVTEIGANSFTGCNITSVTIPNSVITIGLEAFKNCHNLSCVTIGNGVTYIKRKAFYGCDGLKKIIINNIANWCNMSFPSYDENPLYYANHIYSDENTEITDLVIPDGTKSINNFVFYNCESLKSVIIPNSVTSIGNNTFTSCHSLDFVIIGDGVTSIGSEAFYECYKMTSISMGKSVNSIGERAFYQCYGLKKVIIKDISTWCSNSFNYLVDNPITNAKHIYSDENTEITDLVIPDGTITIGKYAFAYCEGLTSVTIPNSVKTIKECAFYKDDFHTVISHIKEPFIITYKTEEDQGSFSLNTYYNATLYVPLGTIDKYKDTWGWKFFVFIEENVNDTDIQSIYKSNEIKDIHALNGAKLRIQSKGINILKQKDGTTKKVLVK